MFLLKYILTFVHVASRYKVGRALRTKKVNMVAFVLEAMYKETSVCKYPKIFQCDDGHDFTVDVSKLLKNRMLTFEEQQQKSTFTQLLWKPLTESLQNICLIA